MGQFPLTLWSLGPTPATPVTQIFTISSTDFDGATKIFFYQRKYRNVIIGAEGIKNISKVTLYRIESSGLTKDPQ